MYPFRTYFILHRVNLEILSYCQIYKNGRKKRAATENYIVSNFISDFGGILLWYMHEIIHHENVYNIKYSGAYRENSNGGSKFRVKGHFLLICLCSVYSLNPRVN